MNECQQQAFVDSFAAAWAARDGAVFQALWRPEGKLVYPFANRAISGREIAMLNDLTNVSAPRLTWKLIGWTSRGEVIVIEWECSNVYGERTIVWRGMDKLTLQDGRIIEEVVYADTAPLRALREGKPLEALIQLPAAREGRR